MKHENWFNLWNETVDRKYVHGYDSVIQKEARSLDKHFSNHYFQYVRIFALGI